MNLLFVGTFARLATGSTEQSLAAAVEERDAI